MFDFLGSVYACGGWIGSETGDWDIGRLRVVEETDCEKDRLIHSLIEARKTKMNEDLSTNLFAQREGYAAATEF